MLIVGKAGVGELGCASDEAGSDTVAKGPRDPVGEGWGGSGPRWWQ